MINKEIEKINKDDLQLLITDKVLEYKTIEYKQELPSDSDKNKKEFLADVTSFANASGGDLIYGIEQEKKTGVPKALIGLDIDVDEEKLRLDNLIRTGIQPRLPIINIQEVQLENSKYAIVLRVSKSWISPHRVTLGGHDKFYSRNSSGKYPLDVGELRNAFNLSETVTDRIRNFRTDRIAKILANETPVIMCDNPRIVLHLIPITAFNATKNYDIKQFESNRKLQELLDPITFGAGYRRYNLDGYLTYFIDQDRKSLSYAEFFRNGIIEAVEAYSLPLRNESTNIHVGYVKRLVEALPKYLSLLKSLNIELPAFLFLMLLGVKGYSLGVDYSSLGYKRYPIDRDNLLLPEVLVESYDEKAKDILKPCFDAIWNACGFPRDLLDYNENDNK